MIEDGITLVHLLISGSLASGGSRYTFRIDIRASGEPNGNQKYNYQNGAITNGYLYAPNDIGDSEFTMILRRRSPTGEHICGFKLRGGDHHDSSPDACDFGVGYPTVAEALGQKSDKNYLRFFEKELIHSSFDYYPVAAQVATKGMPDGDWVACKAVTYVSKSDKSEVTNILYVDQDPINFNTTPPTLNNNYQEVARYIDKAGLKGSAGTYTTVVNWRGCTWSIRIDSAAFIDFANVSLRSISPILNNNTGGGGGGGGGGGTGGGGTGGVDLTPQITAPKTHNYRDSGGKLAVPLNVWFIFAGSYWNGTITAPKATKAQIDAAMNTLIDNTQYFQWLFQYRFVKVPVFAGSVVNTTFALPNAYTPANITSLINDTKVQGLIDVYTLQDDPNYLYVIFSDPTHNSSTSASTGSHGWTPEKWMYAFINNQADLPTTTRQLTKNLVNALTDNDPVTGINIDPAGGFASQTSNGHEVVSVSDIQTTPTAVVSGVTVAKYWSDVDGAHIAPDQTPPAFISCLSGANYDPASQACIAVDTGGGGGGSGGGGGDGGGDTGDEDITLAGQGGGSGVEGQPIYTVSKDWTFLLNVGVDTDDSCTLGNPLEPIPFVSIYDVSPDSDDKNHEDMGYNFGEGVTEFGVYVNTTGSILFDKAIRKVTVKRIRRLVNQSGQSCSGLMYCLIYNYPAQKVVKQIGNFIDVSSIDINDQSLTFTQDDNTYVLRVGDMILIHYYDITATADRCLRVGRTSKDTIDSINSFKAIRAPSQYFGNSSQDPGFTLYT